MLMARGRPSVSDIFFFFSLLLIHFALGSIENFARRDRAIAPILFVYYDSIASSTREDLLFPLD